MQPCCQVTVSRHFSHSMRAIVRYDAGSIEPHLTTIITCEIECPITCIRDVDQSAKSRPPIVLETIIKTWICRIHWIVLQRWLNPCVFRGTVDQWRHWSSVETDSFVIKELCKNTLCAVAWFIGTRGWYWCFKRCATAVFDTGLIVPSEGISWRKAWNSCIPMANTARPCSIFCLKAGV